MWPEILALEAGETLRDYMHRRSEWIEYMETKDAGVLKDIDTPADYEEAKGGQGAYR
jgi:CTP:molybdopterin cytidylyltransferase MocA